MPDPIILAKNLAKLSRPQNALYPALLTALCAYAAKAGPPTIVASFICMLSVYAIAATYNNVHDQETDKLNKRADNPLTSTVLSPLVITLFISIHFAFALISQLWLRQPVSLAILGIYILLLGGYSHPKLRLQARGLIATGLLTVCYGFLPVLMGVAQTHTLHNVFLWKISLMQALLTFPLLLAKDYKDVTGDAKTGKKTPLVRLGVKKVRAIALTVSVVAAASFIVLASTYMSGLLSLGVVAITYVVLTLLLHIRRGRMTLILHKFYLLFLVLMPAVIVVAYQFFVMHHCSY